MRTQHTTAPLQSLGCGSTGRAVIERSLRELPGVLEASVNPVTEMAYVEFDPARCSEEEVAAAVRATGYGETRAARSRAQGPAGTAVGRIPAGRFALAGGLWLAAGFTLCDRCHAVSGIDRGTSSGRWCSLVWARCAGRRTRSASQSVRVGF
jgi:copper chaperone CopZ